MNEITLTRTEALEILLSISRIEGFLFNVKDSSTAIDLLEYPVELLTKKLGCDGH